MAFCKTAWSDAADGSYQLLHLIFHTLQSLEILHSINIKFQGQFPHLWEQLTLWAHLLLLLDVDGFVEKLGSAE